MAVKINWTHNSQVVNGPKVTGSGTVEADAYDNIEVTVPAKVGTTNGVLTVDVQPGAAGKVKFLLVKSDRYADLTYDIDADPDLAGIKLDAQLLLVGEGALAMAGGAPQTFKFTNAGSQAANVQILVARDATTPSGRRPSPDGGRGRGRADPPDPERKESVTMPVSPTYPGVYIEEVPSGVRTITGVATSITAFLGRALFGPVNEPTTVNSFADFERAFGGLAVGYPMSYAVRDFYLNGGSQALIVRLFNDDGLAAAGLNPDGVADFTLGPLALVAANPGAWANDLNVAADTDGITQEVADRYGLQAADLFNLTVARTGANQPPLERHINLTVDANSTRRVDRVLAQQSSLIRAPLPLGGIPTGNDDGENGGDSAALGGSAEFLGSELDKTGLYSLLKADLFNILCIPPDAQDGDVPVGVYPAAAEFCADHRAMLIVDSPVLWSANKETAASDARDDFTTVSELSGMGTNARNAAVYFPRVRKNNPLREDQIETFVPCGIVAGVWARTDVQRGVWKAPAGLDAALNGIQGLEVNLTDAENGMLNPLGINCLRSFPVNGRVVWGARTLRGADQLADEYKYVPVRRLALYIEESLYRGTQWVVFEPNDEPLWAQIRLNVGAFMQNLFRQGAFQGRTPREAFLVKCDRETTTQNDINLGIVNIVVGFAPLKPAEFVIIKIQQLAGQIEA